MDKLNGQIAQFSQAVERLGEVLDMEQNDVVRDSAIQRFEFCTDLAWKSIKTYLQIQKGEAGCKFPKDCIREAFKAGLITKDDIWFTVIDYRNLSSHTYSEKLAKKVAKILPEAHSLFSGLLVNLKNG